VNDSLPNPIDRREFLRGATRLSLAAGLAGSSALLVLHPHGSRADCIRPIVCGDCTRFAGCELPKAQLARESKGGSNA